MYYEREFKKEKNGSHKQEEEQQRLCHSKEGEPLVLAFKNWIKDHKKLLYLRGRLRHIFPKEDHFAKLGYRVDFR